jgi:large subunit ribosomal protein L35Ae
MSSDPKKVQKETRKIRKTPRKTAACRLWVKSIFTGFRRAQDTQNVNQVLLKIQGVNDAKDTQFYQGKRCAYIYKAGNTKNNTRYRCIWGTVSRAHGGNGVVIAKFKQNLPPRAMGATVRVFLYPHRFNGQSPVAAQ